MGSPLSPRRYTKYAMNNAMYANFVGKGYGNGPFGPTTRDVVEVTPPAAKAPKGKGPAQQEKETPEQKAAKAAAKDAEKLRAKIIKEGGKKGVEIEGASDEVEGAKPASFVQLRDIRSANIATRLPES